MKQASFRIVTRGELLYGFDREEVSANLHKLCRYRPETLERVFSGEPFIFKANLDKSAAERYKAALDRTGINCRLVLMPEKSSVAAGQTTARPATAVFRQTVPPREIVCPKCDQRQPAGTACVSCGIVFAKFKKLQEKEREAGILGVSVRELEETRARTGQSGLPSDAGFWDRIADYLSRHQEQAFILKAFVLIFLILLVQRFLGGLIVLIFMLFPVFFLVYIRMQAAVTGEDPMELLRHNITFIPVMYAEGEKKKEGIAGVTYLLIFINVLVFYGIEIRMDPGILLNNYLFLPAAPNAWNLPVSLLTTMFLHAGNGHLWGNMVFLWAVGTVVERRIGHGKFVALYLLTGVAASLFGAAVYQLFSGETLHALGASGAIAGIMGIFAVRCYFKSMVFPLPILGIFSLILPISLKVRLNSLVIIGLFFLADLSGGIGQISGAQYSMVGHWIHIGGMLAGISLALFLRLGNEAIEERHMEIGARAVHDGNVGLAEGEESLRRALQQNPNNADAMLMLAQIQSKYTPSEEGRDLYRRAITMLIKTEPQKAAEAFSDYFHKYLQGVDPGVQLQLAGIYYRSGDLDMASKALEMLAGNTKVSSPVREKAILQYARVLEGLGLADVARNYYALFIETFPDSSMAEVARGRLGVS